MAKSKRIRKNKVLERGESMLDRHLIAKIRPQAKKENIVFWKDYRITVLQDRLFRVEKNAEKILTNEGKRGIILSVSRG